MNIPPQLKTLIRHLPALKYGDRLRPERDWLVLVGLTLVGVVFGLLASTITFFAATHETVNEKVGAEVATTTPDASEAFSLMVTAREREAANFRSVYVFVDPSR